jgi:cytoskeletal protein RodZ
VRERKEPQTWDAESEQPLPEAAAQALPNVEMLRDALTRVTEEINEVTSEAEEPQEGFPSFSYSQHPFSQNPESTGSRRGIAVAVVLVLLAMALAGGAWWWQKQHLPGAASAPPSAVSNPSEQPSDASPAAAPGESTPTPEAANASPVAVTGIRHWSSAESTTVAIDLESEVQYEYSHLSNP